MEENTRLTDEMIAQAKDCSLTMLAQRLGFTPIRVGSNHSLKEMDSMRIYNDRTWNRFSGRGNRTGGSTIDFIMEFGDCSTFKEAVLQLLSMNGISCMRTESKYKKAVPENETAPIVLELPKPSDSSKRLYAYLMKTRCLSQKVIDHLAKDRKVLYEDAKHHNLVFLGKNSNGETRYATKRGTLDMDGQRYRGDVSGSDKSYAVNLPNENSTIVKVFESCIDMMSYMDITNDYESNKVVLGMLSDKPLLRFLETHPNISHVSFCLDNDEPARKALYGHDHVNDNQIEHVAGLYEKYKSLGYKVTVEAVPKSYGKDFNEYLIKKRTPAAPEQEQNKPTSKITHTKNK